MAQWRKDARSEAFTVDLEALIPKDHLLQKIEKGMDFLSDFMHCSCGFVSKQVRFSGKKSY